MGSVRANEPSECALKDGKEHTEKMRVTKGEVREREVEGFRAGKGCTRQSNGRGGWQETKKRKKSLETSKGG